MTCPRIVNDACELASALGEAIEAVLEAIAAALNLALTILTFDTSLEGAWTEQNKPKTTRITGYGSELRRDSSIDQHHRIGRGGSRLLRTIRDALVREYGVRLGESPYWIDETAVQEEDPRSLATVDRETAMASDLADALEALERELVERGGGDLGLRFEVRQS